MLPIVKEIHVKKWKRENKDFIIIKLLNRDFVFY